MENTDYIPGVCNIGKEERKARRNWPIGTSVFTVVLIIALQLLNANHFWRLLIFFPVAAFAITFQQVYFGFCVAYGSNGLYNFGPMGKPNKTTSEENLQKDKAKVKKMVITGIVAGIVAALIYFALPV